MGLRAVRDGWLSALVLLSATSALFACGEPEAAVQHAEPLLTIGRQLQGPTGEIFTEVVDGRITPDGRHIVLLDAVPPYVRVFDRQGALVAALIPEGDGPMEAMDPHALAVTESTFALAELGRITVATLEGQPIASALSIPFIPQSITRGCDEDWLVYGRGRAGDSITWLRALSITNDAPLVRTILADVHPGPGTLVRRARPVVARDGRVLVYHDAPGTPRILQFDCPDYELVKDSPVESAKRAEAETRAGNGAVTISPADDARPLSSVLFAGGTPLIVRSRWRDGLWYELVDATDAVVREGPATYRILDVVDGLALLAVGEPVSHAVVVDVEAVLVLAPIATDSGSNGKAP